jgi:hypothetical protein
MSPNTRLAWKVPTSFREGGWWCGNLPCEHPTSYAYRCRGNGHTNQYRNIGLIKRISAPRVEMGKNTSTVIPAGSKRRRKGNRVVSDETVMSPPRLWPLTDCITNYRSVLSSERAPQGEEQSSFPAKERKK